MKRVYRLTPRAYGDLKSIARYTRQRWSDAQRVLYLNDLVNRFVWLAENPRAGKHRPDVGEGCYCFPQGAHLVFYLIQADGIDIIGVPHKQMDVLQYFDD